MKRNNPFSPPNSKQKLDLERTVVLTGYHKILYATISLILGIIFSFISLSATIIISQIFDPRTHDLDLKFQELLLFLIHIPLGLFVLPIYLYKKILKKKNSNH